MFVPRLTLLSPLLTNPKRIAGRWRFWRHNRMRDACAISSHYDVSNEFYALWLDRRRVYFCAYFRTDHVSLDLAQEQRLEHVGVRKLPDYFRKVHVLLKPGGLSCNHGLTPARFEDEHMDGNGDEFIARHVFPDGKLTRVSRVIDNMARQGPECLGAENLRPHYARTLWQWAERLDTGADESRATVGEQNYSIW